MTAPNRTAGVHSTPRLCENSAFVINTLENPGLVTHYSANGTGAACGRTSQTLNSTPAADQVSCKSCLRSLASPQDSAVAAKAKTPSLAELRKQRQVQAKAKPAFSVKASWQARLSEQSERCRLPRGVRKQVSV